MTFPIPTASPALSPNLAVKPRPAASSHDARFAQLLIACKFFVALFAFVVLALPFKTRANFNSLAANLNLFVGSSFYRLPAPTKPWQLAGITVDSINQTLTFNNHLYAVVTIGGTQQLLVSDDGLKYVPDATLGTFKSLVLRTTPSFLLGTLNTGSATKLLVTGTDGAEQLLDFPVGLTDATTIVEANQQLVALSVTNNTVTSYALSSGAWASSPLTATCSTVAVVNTLNFAGFNCGGVNLDAFSNNQWQSLFPENISSLQINDWAAVGVSQATKNKVYYFANGLLSTWTVGGVDMTKATVQLAGNRVLIHADKLYELSLTDGSLATVATDPTLTVVVASPTKQLFAYGSIVLTSNAFGNWQALTVPGKFTDVLPLSTGFVLWQRNGSQVEFLANASTTAVLQSGGWAGSSKILEVVPLGGSVNIYLLNSSGTPNLYQTTDVSSGKWSRITLPTKITYEVPINQTRNFPSGTLVQVNGSQSVLPNVVGSEEMYLQDGTGGIQIYLDQSKGQLPSALNQSFTASGQISTSQTKRVILDTLDDLVATTKTFPALTVAVTPDQVSDNLGSVVTLSGTLGSVTSSYLQFNTLAGLLKLNFQQLANKYQAQDTISAQAIVDYNSSSGAIETWLVSNDQLLNRVVPPVTATSSSTAATSSTASVTPDATNPTNADSSASTLLPEPIAHSTPVPTKKASLPTPSTPTPLPQPAPSRPTAQPAAVASTVTTDTLSLVAAENTNNVTPLEAGVMSTVSLCAGLLIIRGRRLRRLLKPILIELNRSLN